MRVDIDTISETGNNNMKKNLGTVILTVIHYSLPIITTILR